MKNKIGFIAVGQAGGNIGKLLKDNGFDVVFLNSSKGDLDTLNVDENKKYHISDGLGCAKDREVAKQVAKNDFKNINEFIQKGLNDKELYYILFSSGGGTGSGISPTLAKIYSQALNKKVGIITILPSDKDTLQAQINSYECMKELVEIEDLCGFFILDNTKNVNVEHINEKFVNMFTKIFEYKKYETSRGNIDEAEILKLLETKGAINIATCKNEESTKKLIENIKNNIFADCEKDSKIKYLGLSKGMKFEEDLFKSEIGKYLDKFENINKEYTLAILSGLTIPFTRINQINKKIIAEKETIIKLNTAVETKLEDIDFLNNIKNNDLKNIEDKGNINIKENLSADEILEQFF